MREDKCRRSGYNNPFLEYTEGSEGRKRWKRKKMYMRVTKYDVATCEGKGYLSDDKRASHSTWVASVVAGNGEQRRVSPFSRFVSFRFALPTLIHMCYSIS